MQGASGYSLSHAFLSAGGELKGGSFFVEGPDSAVATTVAIEPTSSVRGDQLGFGEVELSENVSLLTKEILLMVAGEERGRGGGREREECDYVIGEISMLYIPFMTSFPAY